MRILEIINITQDYYSAIVFDTGMRYAELYLHHDQYGVMAVTTTKEYWEWWTNQFEIIDQDFITHFEKSGYDRIILKKWWLARHEPERIIAIPNKMVIHKAWEQMVSNMMTGLAPTINQNNSSHE